MATINAVLIKGIERVDGRRTIYISIAHKSVTRYISTGIALDGEYQLSRNKIIKHPDAEYLNRKLTMILRRYEEKLLEIDTDVYTCNDLVKFLRGIRKMGEGNTLNSALDIYLRTVHKEQTVKAYTLAVKRFCNFMGGDVLLSTITTHDIQAYHNRMVDQKLSPTSINIYMTNLKVIIDHAKKLRMVTYHIDPFEVYKKPKSNIRDLDITVKELRRIRNMEPSTYPLRVTRDIFMLSYYLGGINVGDMLAFNYKGAKKIAYTRLKTENTKNDSHQTCFTIQPEAQAIIKKYMRPSGKLVFGKYDNRSKITNLLNRNMKHLALEADISKYISYYTARKSFVQHGFELGIPLETLEYCIGQTMKTNRPIFNYVKIMSRHADTAIRQVIDNLNSN